MKKNGPVNKSNIYRDTDSCSSNDIIIYPGDRIKTVKNSAASILLNDGTGIDVLENSDLIIYSIVNIKNKTLTSLFSDYGRFKIIQHNGFFDASFVFKTRTSVIKTVCATVNIISAGSETGIFVYKGEAGFANSDPSIDDAFVVKSGYESFLKRDTKPSLPVEVNIELRSSWLKRHILSKDKDRILRHDKTTSAIDWLFIEKK